MFEESENWDEEEDWDEEADEEQKSWSAYTTLTFHIVLSYILTTFMDQYVGQP